MTVGDVVTFVPAPPSDPRSLKRRLYGSHDPRSTCPHDSLEYDPHARTVECSRCASPP